MRKYMALILVAVLLVACIGCGEQQSSTSAPTLEPTATAEPGETNVPLVTPNPYVYRWLKDEEGDTVLLGAEEIYSINRDNFGANDAFYQPDDIVLGMTRTELQQLILDSRFSLSTKYDAAGSAISAELQTAILANTAMQQIELYTRFTYYIVTSRTSLLYYPTETQMYDFKSDVYDRNVKDLLSIGTPLLVLHKSSDGKYCFVKTGDSVGWVANADIAEAASMEDWNYFTDAHRSVYRAADSFVVVTVPSITLEGEALAGSILEMGSSFFFVSKEGTQYRIVLPSRDGEGKLIRVEAMIPSAYVSEGYMPYTFNNMAILAFRYYGIKSSGGSDEGILTSALFASRVYRSMGIKLSSFASQQRVMSTSTNLSNMSASEKAAFIDAATGPVILYTASDVMIYLGYSNSHYVIYPAYGSRIDQVLLTNLDNIICANKIL